MIHSSFARVVAQFICIDIFQGAKQFRFADDAAFERLVKTGAEFAVGQRGEDYGIDQDHAGMVEGPDQVFPARRLTPVLPPMEASTCASTVVGICTRFEAAHVE